MKIVDRDQAIVELTRVVDERGENFTYRAPPNESGECAYEYGGQPSCGIGVLFHNLGVSTDVLRQMDYAMFEGVEWPSFTAQVWVPIRFLNAEGIILTSAAQTVLRAFQRMQDEGAPYGDCLLEAAAK